jgi:hypothetical protein
MVNVYRYIETNYNNGGMVDISKNLAVFSVKLGLCKYISHIDLSPALSSVNLKMHCDNKWRVTFLNQH